MIHDDPLWRAGWCHCIACGHEHVAVAPVPLGEKPDMECPNCGAMLCVYDGLEDEGCEVWE